LTPTGYPAALEPGQRAHMAVAWGDTRYAPGEYVVRWDGEGELSFPLSTVRVASRAPGRIVLDVRDTRGPLWVGIEKTNPANPVRDVRYFWPGTEASAASQPFNPEFLRRLAPFSTLRFMDWGAVNHSPLVRWADRPLPGDAVYTSERGVPVERMIDLANTLQAEPWFCIPHQADDDYVRQFAMLGEDPARSAPGRVDRVLERGLERLVRAGALCGRQGARARPADAGRLRLELVRRAHAPDRRDRRCGVRPRRAHALARGRRRAGGLDPVRQRRARLEGHRRPGRCVCDRTVLPRRCGQRSGQARRDAHADAGSRRRADAREHPRRREGQVADNAKLAARYKLPLLAYEAGASDSSSAFRPSGTTR
jgi:hypothetical protein